MKTRFLLVVLVIALAMVTVGCGSGGRGGPRGLNGTWVGMGWGSAIAPGGLGVGGDTILTINSGQQYTVSGSVPGTSIFSGGTRGQITEAARYQIYNWNYAHEEWHSLQSRTLGFTDRIGHLTESNRIDSYYWHWTIDNFEGEGTFSVTTDGRIEFVTERGATPVYYFRYTENTLDFSINSQFDSDTGVFRFHRIS